MPSKKILISGSSLSFLVSVLFTLIEARYLILNCPVATVGTTSSGAVDNMSEIKEVGTKRLQMFIYLFILIKFISEKLSVALGTCRCSMGGQCLVLS
jgi:hypothetical protein